MTYEEEIGQIVRPVLENLADLMRFAAEAIAASESLRMACCFHADGMPLDDALTAADLILSIETGASVEE